MSIVERLSELPHLSKVGIPCVLSDPETSRYGWVIRIFHAIEYIAAKLISNWCDRLDLTKRDRVMAASSRRIALNRFSSARKPHQPSAWGPSLFVSLRHYMRPTTKYLFDFKIHIGKIKQKCKLMLCVVSAFVARLARSDRIQARASVGGGHVELVQSCVKHSRDTQTHCQSVSISTQH